MKLFLCALGLLLIFEGMPYFLSPANMKKFLAQLLELPDNQLHVVGLISMLLGLLLVYLGRS